MSDIKIVNGTDKLNEINVTLLFRAVRWGNDLTSEQLFKAVCASTHLVTAWDKDVLIGIARSMDDGVWSANIDCMMVHPNYRGQGVAKRMLHDLLEMLQIVQFISVSPNERDNVQLYMDAGFKFIDTGSLLQLENNKKGCV